MQEVEVNKSSPNNGQAFKYELYKKCYCMIRAPGMRNFFPVLTVSLVPAGMVWVTFRTHSPPTCGSIIISEQVGAVDGGTRLFNQLEGTFQLPVPVNV